MLVQASDEKRAIVLTSHLAPFRSMNKTSIVRKLHRRLSRRTVAGVIGVGAAMGASSAAAQVSRPDSIPAPLGTVIRPINPFLEAQERGDLPRVTYFVRDSAIEYVVQMLSALSQVPITYPRGDSALNRRISLSLVNAPIMDALEIALRGTGLRAQIGSVGIGQTQVVAIKPGTILDRLPVEEVASSESDFRAVPVIQRDSIEVPLPSLDRHDAAILVGVVTTATAAQRALEIGSTIVTLDVDSIMKIAPISSITDLLDGRVPGLTVQRASGTPGDPARIRIRGMGSVAQYNDPIIVVDGARMYSRQSDTRNLNAGGFINYLGARTSQYSTPSPLDQIEPGIIEKIEVMKGPSASALYGSDAANGVIVLTTKRGHSGPSSWAFAYEQGFSYIPNSPFDAAHTPFSNGKHNAGALTLAGGNSAIQYAYTGAIRTHVGVLKLPDIEQQRYQQKSGVRPPNWMRQPDHLDALGGNGQVSIQVNKRINIALTNLINSQTQKRSSLSNSLNGVLGQLLRQLNAGTIGDDSAALSSYYEKVSSQQRNFLMSLQIRYQPIQTIPITATFGLGRLMREDKNIMARPTFSTPDSTGFYGGGEGTATERTAAINTIIPVFDIASIGMGMNMQYGTVSDLRGSFRNIPLGVTVPSSGDVIEFLAPENSWRLFGWFVEPKISLRQNLFVTPGVRVDNTALPGDAARYGTFPKLSVSWIVSDEENFPLSDLFSTFRLRSAYGYGGASPTAADYFAQRQGQIVSGGVGSDTLILAYAHIPLERSREFEGGFDAELRGGRLRGDLTYYRKTRENVAVNSSLASSLPQLRNLNRYGETQATGIELGVDALLMQRSDLSWQAGLTVSRNTMQLVKLFDQASIVVGPQLTAKTFPKEVKSPNYQAALNSGVTLLNGKVGIFSSITYVGGIIQRKLDGPLIVESFGQNPLAYGNEEVVNALRWQSLSINYEAPAAFANLVRVGSVGVALQGLNLGLRTNYSGMDPTVNGFVTGNATLDAGQVPQPRTWQLRVTLRR